MFAGFLDGLKSLVLSSASRYDGAERREIVRLRCYYPVTCFTDKGKTAHNARVTEMSLKGMRLVGPRKLARDAEVYVAYQSEDRRVKKESVRCKVVWCNKRPTGEYRLGVMYDDSQENLGTSWVKVILRELGFNENNIYQRRRHARFNSSINGDLTTGEGKRVASVDVVDLGVGGALLRCPERVEPETMMRLSVGPYENLPRVHLPGMVIGTRSDPDKPGERLHNFRIVHADKKEVELLGKYLIQLLREGSC